MLDEVDQRILRQVKTSTGKIISDPKEVGGWPDLPSGMPYADGDQDGLADDWETRHGLDTSDASDGAQDHDKDGYTNLEEFLNELADQPSQ
jgi:hypothetical protein